jgi:hypothetical protein
MVKREGRRAELDTFLATLHRPQVDPLEPGIIVFFSRTRSAEAIGLWATGKGCVWGFGGRL